MMKDSVQKGMQSNKNEDDSRSALYDENNPGDMKTYLETEEDISIDKIQDIPGMKFNCYQIGYNKEFRENLKEYYETFKQGKHKCVVLKKIITSINPKNGHPTKRVVYIFDERHIKNFKKRVEKCKGKR